MRIIALETSTQPGSIAVFDGSVLYEQSLPSAKKSAESFAVEMQRALDVVGWPAKGLDGIAVCEGPGSFTGLRIGITVAKTFAYVTGINVVAPSTMRVLAWQAELNPSEEAWCLIDAQRGEVFGALFRNSKDGLVEIESTQIYTPTDWTKKVRSGQKLIGEGLKRINEIPTNALLTDVSDWSPSAAALAACGEELLRRNETKDPWTLVPQYYRKSAAEEKLAAD